jgi:ribonuclease Z
MKPLFHPRLVNPPFDDPVLFIDFLYDKKAILFDLGDISRLNGSEILKIEKCFVSHTHMDHFIGFDHLLRNILRMNKKLEFFGPPGFSKNIEGKLKAYTWNLVKDYSLEFHIYEVMQRSVKRTRFICREGFKKYTFPSLPFKETLTETSQYSIKATLLDHFIPSLAFSLNEQFHININKDCLNKLKLPAGSWLRDLKKAIWKGKPDSTTIKIPEVNYSFSLKELKEKLVIITKGQKITYIPDCLGTPENFSKIINLAKGSDYFFCEAYFLEEDSNLAEARGHLTANQAGMLAKKAEAKFFKIFHFSPRYKSYEEKLHEEAERAFQGSY